MTYTLTIATGEGRDLVVEALRAAARQRTTVARKAAGKVAESKRAGRDVRSSAVKVTGLLAEADVLEELADELAQVEALAILTPAPMVEVTEGGVTTTVPAPRTDDGTSAAAQALAQLAGLTPHDPDAPEDPLTGATPEDEPTTVEEVLG